MRFLITIRVLLIAWKLGLFTYSENTNCTRRGGECSFQANKEYDIIVLVKDRQEFLKGIVLIHMATLQGLLGQKHRHFLIYPAITCYITVASKKIIM